MADPAVPDAGEGLGVTDAAPRAAVGEERPRLFRETGGSEEESEEQ